MAIWVHLYGWAYNPAVCDGDICPQNCDHCSKADLAMGAEDDEDDDKPTRRGFFWRKK